MLLSATKTHNFWSMRQDIKIMKTDLYYSLFFNSPCNLSQCPYSNQVHCHQPSWGWEEACFVKEALSQALLEAVTRYKESIQGRQIKGHTGGARVHRWGEKFNEFGGVLSPSFSSSLTIFVFPLPPSLFVFLSPSLSLFPPPPRPISFILILSPSQPPHISPYQTATLSNLSPSSCWLRSYKLHLKMRNHTSILSLTHPLNRLTSLLFSVSLFNSSCWLHTHTHRCKIQREMCDHMQPLHITQNRRPMLKCHFLLCGFWRKKEDRCLTVHPAFIASDLWMKSHSRQDGPAVG